MKCEVSPLEKIYGDKGQLYIFLFLWNLFTSGFIETRSSCVAKPGLVHSVLWSSLKLVIFTSLTPGSIP